MFRCSNSFGRVVKLTCLGAALIWPHLSVAQGLYGLSQPKTLPSVATQAYHEHKATLVQALSHAYTGNADVDYTDIAIALHEAMVSMAKAELEFGTNEELKIGARNAIKESETQIAQLRSQREKVIATDKTIPTKREPPPDSGGYASRVRACVKSQVAYSPPPRQSANNPTVRYTLGLDSRGIVQNVQITGSSGVAAFDQAVKNGLAACSPFPKPPNGKYPSRVEGDYRMYD